LESENPKYFEELYDRHAGKIYQKCLSFTKDADEARDLAHDVIVKIYLSLSKYNHKSKFSTWMYRVTYNHCIDYQAKRLKQKTLLEELEGEMNESDANEPDDAVLLEINLNLLHELLNELTVSEKTLLLMKYQDQLSIKEIAEITGAGESAIKMKLKRSKEKLIKKHESRR
jgi:RNA polymerase sigma-70 factor (ECF subfamily)